MSVSHKPQLKSTKNYGLFVKDVANKEVTPDEHKGLFWSMQTFGFLPSCPIAVWRNENGKLVVKRGQNRLYFAEMLGLEVWYVEDSQEITSSALERARDVPWKPHHHITTWSNQGKTEYDEVVEFSARTAIPLTLSAALLSGTLTFNNIRGQFESGRFQVKDREFAELVGEMYSAFRQYSEKITGRPLIAALTAAARTEGFDKDRLMSNVERCVGKLRKYSNRDGFLEMLEEIYNYYSKSPVDLKRQALQAMRARNAVKANTK